MIKNMSITVKAPNGRTYCFDVRADDRYLAEWRAAGLEIDEVYASIPAGVVQAGLMRPWIAMQRLWQWLRFW